MDGRYPAYSTFECALDFLVQLPIWLAVECYDYGVAIACQNSRFEMAGELRPQFPVGQGPTGEEVGQLGFEPRASRLSAERST